MPRFEDFKQVNLGLFPTPFNKLENLSHKFKVNIFIKRDDLCGVGVGGNKIRKLQYLMAEAISQKCDIVLTVGGAQSNHAMLTAIVSRKLNIEPVLILQKSGVVDNRGNILLNHILNAKIHFVDSENSVDLLTELERVSEELQDEGRKPYIMPLGGSTPLGTLGYVSAAFELFDQADKDMIKINHIICASGSGGTQAGLLTGVQLLNEHANVIGMKVYPKPDLETRILDLTNNCLELLDHQHLSIQDKNVKLKDCIGPGYALPSFEGTEAIKTVAQVEGVILDPVYTGKAFGGLMKLIEDGYFQEGENIAFIHTGGIPGLFAIDTDY